MSVTGNEGSITGVNNSAQMPTQAQGTGSKILHMIGQFWFIPVILIGAIVVVVSMIMKDPMVVNPTKQAIQFDIDGTHYTVDANTGTTIKLSHGKHTVSMSGKVMGEFQFGWFDEDSVINPTLTEFVVVEVLYGSAAYEDKLSKNKITLSGKTYSGPYTLIPKSLYIKKTWDYGAYEESPESVSTKSNYEIKDELYTAQDFMDGFYADGEKRESETSETEEE